MQSSRGSLFALLAVLCIALPAFAQPAPGAAKKASVGGVAKPRNAGRSAEKPAATGADEKLKERRQARPSEHTNPCQTCHSTLPEKNLREPAKQYAESVHKDPRIGYAGCHRGDPN